MNLILAGVCMMLATMTLSAQTGQAADYFVGKWEVVVEGTPNGDATMLVTFSRVDGKLVGEMNGLEGDAIAIDRIEETADPVSITFFFFAGGYDVDLQLTKKDDNTATGGIMSGMFPATGKRVVE